MECEKLIARLGRLQGAGGGLTSAHERLHLGTRGLDIADNASLDLQRILEPGDRGLPAVLRTRDHVIEIAARSGRAVILREGLIDRRHVMGDAQGT